MRVLLVCGDHLRHLFFATSIADQYGLAAIIIEEREPSVPDIATGPTGRDRENFTRHFKNRSILEKQFFGSKAFSPDCPCLRVKADSLSAVCSAQFAYDQKPDLALIVGTSKITEPLFSALPNLKINYHTGIVPRYKGAACNFWPFYFLEPNWAGGTFHYLTNDLDGGEIIHQVRARLYQGDTIHHVGCRITLDAARDTLHLIDKASKDKTLPSSTPSGQGRLFLKQHFRAEHLRIIYDTFNDDIVDHFLEGRFSAPDPHLIHY